MRVTRNEVLLDCEYWQLGNKAKTLGHDDSLSLLLLAFSESDNGNFLSHSQYCMNLMRSEKSLRLVSIPW